jgi:pyruvate-ferredoxin/flavodoxin oxidoreductase
MSGPRYPGLPRIIDGIGAVVWAETHAADGACAYPITPSTEMGVQFEQAVANGMTNVFGRRLAFLEPESEHSSASAAEGFALAGGRVTNFTCGQGLILMKEVLYVISGKRLPVVFHVGARALTSQALNIHAGHDDVFGVADAGWGILFAKNVQEAADFPLIARRAAEISETPFLCVQDGFLTTHTVQDAVLPEADLIREFLGEYRLPPLFDPLAPRMIGIVANQDAYMPGKIGQRAFYAKMAPALEASFERWAELTGRRYGLVESHRLEDADTAIVALGSMAETAMATADALRAKGVKAGVLNVRTLRPFPGAEVASALAHVRAVSVLERLDVPGMQSNPLATEVKSALFDALQGVEGYPAIQRVPDVLHGAAGLGSRDVRPADLVAVFDQMELPREARRRVFALGIDHPDALLAGPELDLAPPGTFRMRIASVGGFGTVTTNKILATVAGEIFGLHVQAYPRYGSEKKGLPTSAFLTISPGPIRTHCELERVDLLAVVDPAAAANPSTYSGLADRGRLLLALPEATPIPAAAARAIRDRALTCWRCDTRRIGEQTASRTDLVARMQGIALLGSFLSIAPLGRGTPEDVLMTAVEAALRKYFGKQGDAVVNANLEAVRRGRFETVRIDPQEAVRRAPAGHALEVIP